MTRRPIDIGRQNPACPARWHGTDSAYHRAGCRCPHAREEHRLAHKRQREGRSVPACINATGTARRLQALAALGWRLEDIASQYGDVNPRTLHKLTTRFYPTVHRGTAARVRAVYAVLSMTVGPSPIARRRALAKGWAPPLAWDDDRIDDPKARPRVGDPARTGEADETAVLRAVTGDPTAAVREVDRREAVRHLAARSVPESEIAARLRMSPSAVKQMKYRHRMGTGVAA